MSNAPQAHHSRARPASTELPLGQGQVGIKDYVAALWKVGYRGPLCIEREVGNQQERFADIAHGVAVVRDALSAL